MQTSTKLVPLLSNEKLQNSPNLSTTEQNIQNTQAEDLLIYNAKNPIKLGINIISNIKDIQQSYIKGYKITSNIVYQNAEQKLQNMTYSNNDDFLTYITLIYNK